MAWVTGSPLPEGHPFRQVKANPSGETAPEVWRRHLHWLLDGLRAEAATPQTQPPLDDDQLSESMRCLRAQRFGRRQ